MEDNRLISIDAKLKEDDLLKYLMLAQNGEVKMLFDYLKHQPLREQAVWHLFDLRREHSLKVFHDLLRACFKQSSFYEQQNTQPWYDDRKTTEERFWEYANLDRRDLFKEYVKRYDVSERAYRDLRDCKDNSLLWRIYTDRYKLREE